MTGGGSQLRHLKQLVEYITGMDTRIGYPNEHLSGESENEKTSPVFSTAVGLLMNAVEDSEDKDFIDSKKNDDDSCSDNEKDVSELNSSSFPNKRKSIFEKWADKFKEFLEKA